MDANELLRTVRKLAVDVSTSVDADATLDLADQLAEHVQKLDDHLSSGGRPPEAWSEGPDGPYMDESTAGAA